VDAPLHLGPEELLDDRYLLDTFLENTPDHVYFKDEQSRFIRVSCAMAAWFGLDDPADAIGRTDFDFFSELHAREAFADEQRLMRTGTSLVGIEERETWPDGRETWVSTTKVPLRDRRGRIVGIFGLSRDITEKKLAERRLAEQAEQLAEQARVLASLALVDELTGLYNRRGLTAYGEQLLHRSRRDGSPAALLFLDLDGLKRINDTLGHAVGDEALRTLADAVRETTRSTDVAARIGGDEFCVVLGGETAVVVELVVDRIHAALRRSPLPFELGVSVGSLEIDSATNGSMEELLLQADRSMYWNKLWRATGAER